MLGQSVDEAVFGSNDIVDDVLKTEMGGEVGEQLRQAIRDRGDTVESVAAKARVSGLMLARMLRGEVPILPPLLIAATTALGYQARVVIRTNE
jgi:hypothetical protein